MGQIISSLLKKAFATTTTTTIFICTHTCLNQKKVTKLKEIKSKIRVLAAWNNHKGSMSFFPLENNDARLIHVTLANSNWQRFWIEVSSEVITIG